ncbi:hypothetical protein SAMN05444421_10242 [Celeribacter marinus]|nr:hypothetical protein SAMN05444421_10242 [Celeribacter marinus]
MDPNGTTHRLGRKQKQRTTNLTLVAILSLKRNGAARKGYTRALRTSIRREKRRPNLERLHYLSVRISINAN